ncbi:hypothetical protein BGY98DRAFT_948104 [Russula aff. rugulosa BPL654]|nr:hypothetical protein BGY98DRAFT_948104 [Russula aff. rugulosa BPL654]
MKRAKVVEKGTRTPRGSYLQRYVDKVRFCSLLDSDGADAYQVTPEQSLGVRRGIPQDVV